MTHCFCSESAAAVLRYEYDVLPTREIVLMSNPEHCLRGFYEQINHRNPQRTTQHCCTNFLGQVGGAGSWPTMGYNNRYNNSSRALVAAKYAIPKSAVSVQFYRDFRLNSFRSVKIEFVLRIHYNSIPMHLLCGHTTTEPPYVVRNTPPTTRSVLTISLIFLTRDLHAVYLILIYRPTRTNCLF